MAAEALGTCLLLVAIVGSGIAASRLSPMNAGLQLFENAATTAFALVAIILALGPVSGAHLNPVITLVDRLSGGVSTSEASAYVLAQAVGAVAGAVIANLMFSLPAIELSGLDRAGGGLLLGEVVATSGLVLVVFGVIRSPRPGAAPFAIGAFIGSAHFFTSSTSFANPAVTLARALSDTFTGIAPSSVLPFVASQLVGGIVGYAVVLTLIPDAGRVAGDVVVPRRGA
jgi:glycerol uptake facilitator-like aquaporin